MTCTSCTAATTDPLTCANSYDANCLSCLARARASISHEGPSAAWPDLTDGQRARLAVFFGPDQAQEGWRLLQEWRGIFRRAVTARINGG